MDNAKQPTITRRARQLAIASLTVAYFTMGTGLMSVIGLLEPMAEQWQVSKTDIALLLTVFSMTFALAAPAIQVVFSRYALRSLLLTGLSLMAIGSLGLAMAPDYQTGMAWRILMALGAAAIGPVATAIATNLAPPDEQVKTLAILFSGMTLASVIGVPTATWIGQQFSWPTVFVLVSALAAGCAFVLARTVKATPAGRQLHFGDFIEVFSTPDTRYAVMTTWLHMSGQFVCYALIALLFIDLYGLQSRWLSPALFAMGIGHLLGNVLTGIYGDRFNANTVIEFSLIGMIIVFAALGLFANSAVLIGGLFFAWSVIGSLFQPPQQKRLIMLNPGVRPLLLAMNASALYLGIACGSALATLIQQPLGLSALPYAAAIVTSLALLTGRLSRRANRSRLTR